LIDKDLTCQVSGLINSVKKQQVSPRPHSPTPWLVLGDFNLIYKARDKNNLNLNRQLMGKFRHALDDCELFEFSLQNRKFTWRNERAEPILIHLDRVFCNTEWELLHTGFRLQKPSHCRSMIIVRLYYVMKKDQCQEQSSVLKTFGQGSWATRMYTT
jgi:hypothetical protein